MMWPFKKKRKPKQAEQSYTFCDHPLILRRNFIDEIEARVDATRAGSAVAVTDGEYKQLQKLNMIDYIPNSRGEVRVPTVYGWLLRIDGPSPYKYC